MNIKKSLLIKPFKKIRINEEKLTGKWWHRLFQVAFFFTIPLCFLFGFLFGYLNYLDETYGESLSKFDIVPDQYLHDIAIREESYYLPEEGAKSKAISDAVDKLNRSSDVACISEDGQYHFFFSINSQNFRDTCNSNMKNIFSYKYTKWYHAKGIFKGLVYAIIAGYIMSLLLYAVYYRAFTYIIFGNNKDKRIEHS